MINDGVAFDTLNFKMDDGSKGINTYFYAIGGDASGAKSEVGSASIVVCGKETLTLVEKTEAVN